MILIQISFFRYRFGRTVSPFFCRMNVILLCFKDEYTLSYLTMVKNKNIDYVSPIYRFM